MSGEEDDVSTRRQPMKPCRQIDVRMIIIVRSKKFYDERSDMFCGVVNGFRVGNRVVTYL